MEWLANLSIKYVLLAVGVLILALTCARLSSTTKDPTVAWIVENVQVVLSVVVVVFLIIRPFLFQAFYIPSTSMEPTLHGPPDHPVGDRLLVNKLIYRVSNPQRKDIAVFKAPPQASPDEKEFIKRVIGLPGETVEVVPPRLTADGKAALVLTTEGSNMSINGISIEENPKVAGDGSTADMRHRYSSDTLKVIANPDARLSSDPYKVTLDGKKVLDDTSGRIREVPGLTAYGGDATVQATAYTIDENPRLIVVRAKKLVYDAGHVLVNGNRMAEPYIAEAPAYAMSPRKLKGNEYFMMGDNRNNSNDSHAWGPLTRDRIIGRAEIVFWPANRFNIVHYWLIIVLGGGLAAYEILVRLFRGRRGPNQ